jgi:indole-3-glycerol phosphate synthase
VTHDYLAEILARKHREVSRRRAHASLESSGSADPIEPRGAAAVAALRRRGTVPRVIAEFKRRSPSAGVLRVREPGDVARIARDYADAGAAAISVLCDARGFGGTPLDARRVARAVSVPVLFKEFVLDPVQIRLARAVGAHLVLLLVRALEPERLRELVRETLRQGMAPVVEAADLAELNAALRTDAPIVGVNARDLRTFRVDPDAALRAVEAIPADRVAVHMSGVGSCEDFARVAVGRADAVLVGEALMRAPSPGGRLREWLTASGD